MPPSDSRGNKAVDTLFNGDRSVTIPLSVNKGSLPYFSGSDVTEAKGKELIDAFTGQPFDLKLAQARAMRRFIRNILEHHSGPKLPSPKHPKYAEEAASQLALCALAETIGKWDTGTPDFR